MNKRMFKKETNKQTNTGIEKWTVPRDEHLKISK
jgi:hypothetical protein